MRRRADSRALLSRTFYRREAKRNRKRSMAKASRKVKGKLPLFRQFVGQRQNTLANVVRNPHARLAQAGNQRFHFFGEAQGFGFEQYFKCAPHIQTSRLSDASREQVVKQDNSLGVFQRQRHRGQFAGAEFEREPFRRSGQRILDNQPVVLVKFGNLMPSPTAFLQFVGDRLGDPDIAENLGEPIRRVNAVEIEQWRGIADSLGILCSG